MASTADTKCAFVCCRGLDGINYQLIPSQQEPALFLIRKERCKAGQQPTVEGLYYVVDGTVYAAPDLLTLCQSRLRKVAFYLQDAVAKLAPRAAFSASDGPHWDFAPPHDHGSLLGAAQATTPAAAKRASDEARVNNILLGLHAQYQPEAANAAGGAAGAGSTAGGVSGGAGAAAASNGGAAVAVRRPASADAVPPAKRARPSS